eukprot:TRINITY_DN2172_c0_g1_i1.p1 TRINITY_DN2172_c0_g1~~TRINITY_DN2172_c0_g1_i1.p1  ORF type:complete len:378 (+),score=93.67 TRINITY_DN2172_c0_g1_i1:451-1584(+)
MTGNFNDLPNSSFVNVIVKDQRNFAENYLLLENTLLERKFCPILQNVLLRDSHSLTLVIFVYCQRIMDASLEASESLKLFDCAAVDPLHWFALECICRGMKIFAFQILVWILTMSEKMHLRVTTTGLVYMDPAVADAYGKLEQKHKFIVDQLTKALAAELVENAICGPDKVKVLLNSLCQLFGRADVSGSLLEAVRVTYKMKSEKKEKLPCEAQILANCGTAFISHKPSYQLGVFHVLLAQQFFKEAKGLLPQQVCEKQASHLEKNIRIADLVPHVIFVLKEVKSFEEMVEPKLVEIRSRIASLQCFKSPNSAQLRDICSAIKFVLQMTVDANDPLGLQKVVNTLNTLSLVFESQKDLSKKCSEWAKSATYKERVAT